MSPSDVVVDIGCADGAMFEELRGRYSFGYGVEPTLPASIESDSYVLYPGVFPDALPEGVAADCITMLAVLEHLSPPEQTALAEGCREVLKPGGRMIITVPSPRVDDVLHVLERLKLVDGMSLHEHYGFEPADTLSIFAEPDFRLVEHRRFQLGLNNLFIFERTPVAAGEVEPAAAGEVAPPLELGAATGSRA